MVYKISFALEIQSKWQGISKENTLYNWNIKHDSLSVKDISSFNETLIKKWKWQLPNKNKSKYLNVGGKLL